MSEREAIDMAVQKWHDAWSGLKDHEGPSVIHDIARQAYQMGAAAGPGAGGTASPEPPKRVYVVELDNQLHAIFATQDAADEYCRSRRDPSEYEVIKWAVRR